MSQRRQIRYLSALLTCAFVAGTWMAPPGASALAGTAPRPTRPTASLSASLGPLLTGSSESSDFYIRTGPNGTEVGVSIRLTDASQQPRIRQLVGGLGGDITGSSGVILEGYVPIGRLADLGGAKNVAYVSPVVRPTATDAGTGGVAEIGAPLWQAAGDLGAGIKVGVIDVGFRHIADAVAAGDLPSTVQVRCYQGLGSFSSALSDCTSGAQTHGTAVAEFVHATAPGALLYLADPSSGLDTLTTIDWMAAQGVRIINASISSPFVFEGPGDGSYSSRYGTAYAAVDHAVAAGILWVNSAGNEAQGTWRGQFKPDAIDPSLNDFAPGITSDPIVLTAGEDFLAGLRWADSWTAPQNDYGLLLYGPDGALVATADEAQSVSGVPAESLRYTASADGTYSLVIRRNSGQSVVLELQAGDGQPLRYRTPTPSLPAPADSANPGEITVGAVTLASPNNIEPYSSIGPTLDGRNQARCRGPSLCHHNGLSRWLLWHKRGSAIRHRRSSAARGVGPLARHARQARGCPPTTCVPARKPPAQRGLWLRSSGTRTVRRAVARTIALEPPAYTVTTPSIGRLQVSPTARGSAQGGLAIDAAGSIVHLVYTDSATGYVEYRRSTNGGGTFTAAVGLSPSSLGTAFPNIASNQHGLLVSTWRQFSSGGKTNTVELSRSTDFGTYWTAPVSLSPDAPAGDSLALAVDSGSHVTLGWTDAATGAVIVRTSVNGGSTFGPPITLGRTSVKPYLGLQDRDAGLRLAFSGSTVVAAWEAARGNVVTRRSTSAGAGTWSSTVTISPASTVYAYPSLAASGSTVVVAYGIRVAGIPTVALRVSTTKGAAWGSVRTLPTTTYGDAFPQISVTGSRVALASLRCLDSKCSKDQSFVRQSSSLGASWGAAGAVSSIGDSRPLAISQGRRLLITYELYASTVSSAGTVYLQRR